MSICFASAEDHRIQMDEEERAWGLGRDFIGGLAPNLPAEFWQLWDAKRVELLDTYRALGPQT